MKELNVSELPSFPQAQYTGEIGVHSVDGVWERNGQQLLCPLSRLILDRNPPHKSWLRAASFVTGWTMVRTFAFKSAMSGLSIAPGKGTTDDATKGIVDSKLYRLLHKLARARHPAGQPLAPPTP